MSTVIGSNSETHLKISSTKLSDTEKKFTAISTGCRYCKGTNPNCSYCNDNGGFDQSEVYVSRHVYQSKSEEPVVIKSKPWIYYSAEPERTIRYFNQVKSTSNYIPAAKSKRGKKFHNTLISNHLKHKSVEPKKRNSQDEKPGTLGLQYRTFFTDLKRLIEIAAINSKYKK